MPIYEYECDICKEKFEKFIRNTNAIQVQCPNCGSREVVRKFSVFGMKSGGGVSAASVPDNGGCSGGGCGNCGCHA